MARALDPYVPQDLATLLASLPAYRQRQITKWLASGVDNPLAMTNLPLVVRQQLVELFPEQPRIVKTSEADDGLTRKVLLECGSGTAKEGVESVLMLYPKRHGHGSGNPRAGRATVCISTQAGCAMGCPFCATGQIGFRRQLTLGETVRQVTVMQDLLQGNPDPAIWGDNLPSPIPANVPDHVTNVVFMGMGEPLGNQKVTLAAVRWLHEEFGLSARSITVSTVGIVPGITKLQELNLPITLALSLHAPNDQLRDDLVPVNQTHNLTSVMTAVRKYVDATNRRVTIEYVMIDNVNSDLEHARELRYLLNRYLRRGSVHVNLIPMNPTPAVPWNAPPIGQQQAFCDILNDSGIPATIRANRGNDIDAACGQLYANYQAASGKTLPIAIGAANRVQQNQMDQVVVLGQRLEDESQGHGCANHGHELSHRDEHYGRADSPRGGYDGGGYDERYDERVYADYDRWDDGDYDEAS